MHWRFALVAILLCGCIGQAPPASPTPPAPAVATALSGCIPFREVACFEPSIAVDTAGRIFAADARCERLARSTDGGATFAPVDAPPLPATSPPSRFGDCLLRADDEGHVFFCAMVIAEASRAVSSILVARTDDGAATWRDVWNGAPASSTPTLIGLVDRPWLTIGKGVAYLSYWQFSPGIEWVARSDDGARSFGAFVQAPLGPAGEPRLSGDGSLLLPAATSGGEVTIAVSRDRGATFALISVAPGGHAASWPTIALDPSGNLYVAWATTDGGILVADAGRPEGPWSAPMRWNLPSGRAMPIPPSIQAREDSLVLVWYEAAGQDQQVIAAHAPAGTRETTTIGRSNIAAIPGSTLTTDFSEAALIADGRTLVAWTSPREGLRVATIRLSLSSGPTST